MTDLAAIRVAAKRIIEVANHIKSNSLRHDLVAEAAAIITLCGEKPSDRGHGVDIPGRDK